MKCIKLLQQIVIAKAQEKSYTWKLCTLGSQFASIPPKVFPPCQLFSPSFPLFSLLFCFSWGTFFPYKLQHDHNFLWSSCGRSCLVCLVLKNTRAGIARVPRIPVPTPSQLQSRSWLVQIVTKNKLIILQWLSRPSPPTSKPSAHLPEKTWQNKTKHYKPPHTPGPFFRKKISMPGFN